MPGPSRTVDRDRRNNRSDDAFVALTRLLESTRRANRFEVLAVADSNGCLVAGAGGKQRCEELAAFAPLSQPSRRGPPAASARAHTSYRKMRLDGMDLYVCAESPGEAPSEAGLVYAADGCQRILARAS